MIYILTSSIASMPAFLEEYKTVESLSEVPYGSKVVMFNYGKLIKKEDLGKIDLYNVHNSLLPKYRGLHAFTWAIINGETELGYTLHKVTEGIDDGAIMSQIKFTLSIDENINDAFEKGNEVLERWLPQQLEILERGSYDLVEQDCSKACYVARRREEDAIIDWRTSSVRVHNFIRSMTPPYTSGAYTFFEAKKLFILESSIVDSVDYIGSNGQIVAHFPKRGVLIKTGDSVLLVKVISYEGVVYNAMDFFKTSGARLG